MMEGTQRRRRVLLVLAVATMLFVSSLQGCTCCAGAGTVAKSVFDSLLPMPSQTVWARCPTPGSHSDSYRDASGSCTNYVYDVEAATSDGTRVTVSIILFGREASGKGWLKIDAKGSSGMHYDSVDASEVPQAARDALGGG